MFNTLRTSIFYGRWFWFVLISLSGMEISRDWSRLCLVTRNTPYNTDHIAIFYRYNLISHFRLLFTGIIPFVFLSTLNVLIYNRMQANSLSSVRSKSSATKKAGSLAAVLIAIGEMRKFFFKVSLWVSVCLCIQRKFVKSSQSSSFKLLHPKQMRVT